MLSMGLIKQLNSREGGKVVSSGLKSCPLRNLLFLRQP